MRADEELDATQKRQLRHDVQSIYDDLNSKLAAHAAGAKAAGAGGK